MGVAAIEKKLSELRSQLSAAMQEVADAQEKKLKAARMVRIAAEKAEKRNIAHVKELKAKRDAEKAANEASEKQMAQAELQAKKLQAELEERIRAEASANAKA